MACLEWRMRGRDRAAPGWTGKRESRAQPHAGRAPEHMSGVASSAASMDRRPATPAGLFHHAPLRPVNDLANTGPDRGWRRGFWCLMGTQFQGAFSDNVLRWLVVYLVMAQHWEKAKLDRLVSDAGTLFAVPFLLFCPLGGWLADRYSKRRVMIGVKVMEVAIMSFATWALAARSLGMQLAAICLMGVHSACFAASKYGSLPELVPLARLSWANGIIEMLTFLAAISGTLAAGALAQPFVDAPAWPGVLLLVLAFAGLGCSLGIARLPAASPGKRFRWNFLADLWREFAWMRTDRDLWRANLGNTGFFFIATLVNMNLLLYAQHVLQVEPLENSGLLVALFVGIAAGSMLAGRLSHDRIEYGLVPVGALLLAATSLVLGWPGMPKTPFTIALVLLGVGGGLFIVPLTAVLQHRPPAERKGAVQGAASWLSWIGISGAAALQGVLNVQFGWTPGEVFWLCGACAVLAGVYATLTRPRAVAEMIARWRGAA